MPTMWQVQFSLRDNTRGKTFLMKNVSYHKGIFMYISETYLHTDNSGSQWPKSHVYILKFPHNRNVF